MSKTFLTINNHCSLTTIPDNEIYEKLRPLKTFHDDQAHGDDLQINSFELFSHESQPEKQSNETASEISLKKQRSPIDRCEYEIDLGNGRITKSVSSYQTNDKQRMTSIVSVDSIQPITTGRIYKEHTIYPKEEIAMESNILFNSNDNDIKERKFKFSSRTVIMFSFGTMIVLLLIVVMFFVF